MKTNEIVNKETNETLTTKDGVPLVKNTLELGDKFISLYNKPVSEQKGEAKFPRYFTKAKVMVDGKESEVFLDLTPTQYNALLKVSEDPEQDDLNQYVFSTYEYDNDYDGKSIGITNKVKKESISFE